MHMPPRLLACVAVVTLGLAPAAFAKGMADRITSKRLDRAAMVDGVDLPAGTTVTYREQFNPYATGQFDPPYLIGATLGGAGTPCGVALAKGTTVELSNGRFGEQSLVFTKIDDRVMTFRASASQIIDGVALAAGTAVTVQCRGELHREASGEAAKLRGGTVEHAYTLDKQTFPANSRLTWFPARDGGRVSSVILASPATLGGFSLPADAQVTFYADGGLQGVSAPRGTLRVGAAVCDLARVPFEQCDLRLLDPPRVLSDGHVDASTLSAVELHRNGKLARCTLPATTNVSDYTCVGPDGAPQLCYLRDEQRIGGILLVGVVELYPSGRVAKGFASRQQKIGGATIAGRFELSADGSVR